MTEIIQEKKPMIDELTGLRGVASLLIILNHVLLLFPLLRGNDIISDVLGWCGIMGMNLFFILSGFVIHYNYADKIRQNHKEGILKFIVARFARLYPLYIVFILGYFIFNCFYIYYLPVIFRNVATLPVFIAAMQSWFYVLIDGYPVIYCQESANISWSISTEMALYLFFIPFAFIKFNFKSHAAFIITFLLIIIVNILYQHTVQTSTLIEGFFQRHFGTSAVYNPQEWLVYHSPLARLLQFLFGCMIAEYFSFLKGQHIKGFKGVYILAFLFLAGCIFQGNEISIIYKHIISTVCLMLCVLGIAIGSNKLLKSKPFIFLGNVSYSSYLLYTIFIQMLVHHGKHIPTYLINTSGYFIGTYMLAYLVYKYYEMPARKKVKEFLLNNRS